MNLSPLYKTIPMGVGLLILAAFSLASTAFRLPPAEPMETPLPAEDRQHIAVFFMPQVQAWSREIERWAAGYGLDPNLVATVMQIESCGDPRAVSRADARGLFQVMPFHFQAGEDTFDPETNARRGLEYLSQALLKSKGDVPGALAGYNGGHGVIGLPPSEWPSETQRYVYWGGGIYADAESGVLRSPRLQEWLAAGGSRLCFAP